MERAAQPQPVDPKKLLHPSALSRVIRAARGSGPSHWTIRLWIRTGLYGVTLKTLPDGRHELSCIEWIDDFRRKAGLRRRELQAMERARIERIYRNDSKRQRAKRQAATASASEVAAS